jgi:DUF2970 family protein
MHTIKTVLFGFLGVRRKVDHQNAELNPLHVVVAGIALVILFVLTLVTIVKIVTS